MGVEGVAYRPRINLVRLAISPRVGRARDLGLFSTRAELELSISRVKSEVSTVLAELSRR